MPITGLLPSYAYFVTRLLTLILCLALGGGARAQVTSIPSPPQAADPAYYNPSCDKPKNHDEADLCQQLRMAKAAEDAVWWARAQSILGILGFIGVVLTLIFTGWTAATASRQVRLSRQSVIDTDRAFVYISEGLMGAVVNSKTQKVESWKTSVRWKNSGTTPTRNLRLFLALSIRKDGLPDSFDFPVLEVPDVHVMIAPGSTIDSVELPISLEDMEDIVAEKKYLHVWGWAEYDDVFEGTPRHRTEVCIRWRVGGNVRDPQKFSSRYEIYGRHNGADEECEFPVVTASSKDMRQK